MKQSPPIRRGVENCYRLTSNQDSQGFEITFLCKSHAVGALRHKWIIPQPYPASESTPDGSELKNSSQCYCIDDDEVS